MFFNLPSGSELVDNSQKSASLKPSKMGVNQPFGMGMDTSWTHREPWRKVMPAPSPSVLVFQPRWWRKEGGGHRNHQLEWHLVDKSIYSSEGGWGAEESFIGRRGTGYKGIPHEEVLGVIRARPTLRQGWGVEQNICGDHRKRLCTQTKAGAMLWDARAPKPRHLTSSSLHLLSRGQNSHELCVSRVTKGAHSQTKQGYQNWWSCSTIHIPQVSRDGTIRRYSNALSQLALQLVSFIISTDSLSISSISQPIINMFNHPWRNLGSPGSPFLLQNMLLAELAHFIMDLSAGEGFFFTSFETYKMFKGSDDLGWLAELASLKSSPRKKQTAALSHSPSL